MNLLTLDYETFYEKGYTLTSMTTEAYVRDSRFEPLCLGLKFNAEPTEVVWGDKIYQALMDYNVKDCGVIAHNAHFDGAIMNWHYGIKPKAWFDTLSMARPFHAKEIRLSLKALSEEYNLGKKGEVVRFMGMRLADFDPYYKDLMTEYCATDIDLTYELFLKLVRKFPRKELPIVDQTIRMFTEPTLQLNTDRLVKYKAELKEQTEALIKEVSPDGTVEQGKKAIGSDATFAKMLRDEGIEPPMKYSEKQDKQIFAFAKTDKEFTNLANHPSIRVQALVAVRQSVKSTQEEARVDRLIGISKRGALPVMLKYYGAHTGRFSAGDKINMQNLTHGPIRGAISAPDGYVLMVNDLSQIEARLLAYVAGQDDLVQAFREKRDVYCEFAGDLYNRPVTKEDGTERFVGKTCILALGYNMGWQLFRERVALGGVILGEQESRDIVGFYRRKNKAIVALWGKAQYTLGEIVSGRSGILAGIIPYGPDGYELPNGHKLIYPNLTRHEGDFYYTGSYGVTKAAEKRAAAGEPPDYSAWTKIYGGKLVENIIQGMASVVIKDNMLSLRERQWLALQVHDDIMAVVQEQRAEAHHTFMTQVMSTPPVWAPDLPLDCEGAYGKTYAECK